MNITKKQNSEENLKRLAAQRYLYSKAKIIRNYKLILAFFLVLISPIIILLYSKSASILGIIGGISVVITFIIDIFELNKIKIAANIQEQFDLDLYDISWNKIMCKTKASNEVIYKCARNFNGDKKKLLNWYGNLNDVSFPNTVLICQRANLIWDWRLRRKFALKLLIVLLALLLFGISISLIKKLSLENYLIGIFIPSFSAFLFGLKEVSENYQIAKDKEDLMTIIDSNIEKDSISTDELRQIQDRIYDLRIKQALIPDWFYEKYRTDYELDLLSSNKEFRRKLKNN